MVHLRTPDSFTGSGSAAHTRSSWFLVSQKYQCTFPPASALHIPPKVTLVTGREKGPCDFQLLGLFHKAEGTETVPLHECLLAWDKLLQTNKHGE